MGTQDDIVFYGETCEEVERRIEGSKKAMEYREMQISRQKIEYLSLGSQMRQAKMGDNQLRKF